MTFSKLALSAGATLLAYSVYKLLRVVIRQWNSPLRELPGPRNTNWIYGNLKEIFQADNAVLHEEWVRKYGSTISYKGIASIRRLYTVDLKALAYILNNSDDFGKPGPVRYNLSRLLGAGVLVVEGEEHRKQRRIMNPAFGPSQIRELTVIFNQKANQLRDIWAAQITRQEDTPPRVNIVPWLSRLTLDVIGLAGFHYNFDTLDEQPNSNELSDAFSTIFRSDEFTLFPFLQGFFPPLRLIVTRRDRIINAAKAKMNQIARQLLQESKAAVTAKGGFAEKGSLRGRDLLSLLTRANMAEDIPEYQKLKDEDVLAQVPTFLVAGHETTSNATTWALYALAIQPDIQAKLRQELLTLPTDTPTMDELNSLHYLDFVVRETLRLHTPVASSVRYSLRDNVIPLGSAITDKKGRVLHEIHVRKGDAIFIPIVAINRSKDLWGEDASEFRPERWESPPKAVNNIPGVWSNLLTFLGGPRACIGYRFSIVETKAILFSLVKAFHFELAVPKDKITKKAAIVQRPLVIGEEGNQMPMYITPYQHE